MATKKIQIAFYTSLLLPFFLLASFCQHFFSQSTSKEDSKKVENQKQLHFKSDLHKQKNLPNTNARNKAYFSKKNLKKTVILCFHDVGGKGMYSVSKKDFVSMVDILHNNEIQVVSLYDWWASRKSQYKKPVVVFTFDDGYFSIFKTIIPLLEKYNFGATFFIYLDRYSDNSIFYNRLSKLGDQFEIGSHSFTHDNLIRTYQNNKQDFFKELFLSKKKLAYLTKRNIYSFAWPYGLYQDEMVQLAKNAGYTIQVSSYGAAIKEKNALLGRYTILAENPIQQLKKILWETLKIRI